MPDAPQIIDLSAGGGPWPAFVISGATGVTGINGAYALLPFEGVDYIWEHSTGEFRVSVQASDLAAPSIGGTDIGETLYFDGPEYGWPWAVASAFVGDNGAGGTLSFTRALDPPKSVAMEGAAVAVQATLTTALTGANNDLLFTAVPPGRLGNDVRIRYVDPAANNAALAVSVSGRDITVNLATGAGGTITSTANQIGALIGETTESDALVDVDLAASSNGTGIVTAMAWTALTGGTGGLPLPPETVTI